MLQQRRQRLVLVDLAAQRHVLGHDLFISEFVYEYDYEQRQRIRFPGGQPLLNHVLSFSDGHGHAMNQPTRHTPYMFICVTGPEKVGRHRHRRLQMCIGSRA